LLREEEEEDGFELEAPDVVEEEEEDGVWRCLKRKRNS
jgi:hypothetical protein